MSDEQGKQEQATPDGYESWQDFWATQNWPWRTEPEIEEKRQKVLTERRAVEQNIEQGIYPFKDEKLSRADIEWLLIKHESDGVEGPVDWTDEQQREREGLNLRGADLRSVDLSGLPLANLIAGYPSDEELGLEDFEEVSYEDTDLQLVYSRKEVYESLRLFGKGVNFPAQSDTHLDHESLDFDYLDFDAIDKSREAATAHFERANLTGIHLEGADLEGVHLEGANLTRAHLEGADLEGARLIGTNLAWAHFEGASLVKAALHGAYCGFMRIETIARTYGLRRLRYYEDPDDYPGVYFMGADLTRAKLTWADLTAADLRGADLTRTNLSGVSLRLACLEETKLRGAWLGGTQVSKAFGAAIRVYVPGFPDLFNGTDLSGASCDSQTRLDFIGLGSRKEGMAQLTDVRWGGANLTVVNWATLETAANERPNRLTRQAQKQAFTSLVGRFQITNRLESWFFRKIYPSRILPYANRIDCRIDAARANRQLANVLRDQGMSRDADRFAYRAKVCGRTETLMDGALPQYLGSLLLDVISGYGFKPLRSIVTYLIVLGIFAAAYFGVTNFDVVPFLHTHATPLTWYEALVLSVSSFHGRGLFPTGLALGDPIAIIAAFEAVIGLLIEIIFIATFTQRYFNR